LLNSAARNASTNYVHVIILDSLSGGEVIADQTGSNARNLVGADCGAHAAAANGYPALHIARRHLPGEWGDKIGIVVPRIQTISPEVDYLVTRRRQARKQIFLQPKPTVIGRDSKTHILSQENSG
jgi:hypothetical protein